MIQCYNETTIKAQRAAFVQSEYTDSQTEANIAADRSSFDCFARITWSFLPPAEVEFCMTP